MVYDPLYMCSEYMRIYRLTTAEQRLLKAYLSTEICSQRDHFNQCRFQFIDGTCTQYTVINYHKWMNGIAGQWFGLSWYSTEVDRNLAVFYELVWYLAVSTRLPNPSRFKRHTHPTESPNSHFDFKSVLFLSNHHFHPIHILPSQMPVDIPKLIHVNIPFSSLAKITKHANNL